MEGLEIPSFFICPISLQIMRDPVTLSTGITYDRHCIERWMFSAKHSTCPVTKQPLPEPDLTPNSTLRRLIQAWCTDNPWSGVERFPTPRPSVDKARIAKLLGDADSPESLMSSLRELKGLVYDSERNRRCIEATPGAVDYLASIIRNCSHTSIEEGVDDGAETTCACDEALDILYSLQISDEGLLDLMGRNCDFIESLTAALRQPKNQSRAHAMLLLSSVVAVISPTRLIGLKEELFQEIVRMLRDRISHRAMKTALRVLGGLCPWGRNRIKAVGAGAVPVLIELLLEEQDRRACEMVLVALDRLCGCAEGRAEVAGHAAGIAVVSKRILRVSEVASERAVRVLHSLSRFAGTPAVLLEMLQVGAVSKLCLLLQVDGGVKAKEKAREILMLHSRVWRKSPCLSPHLQASYPSS